MLCVHCDTAISGSFFVAKVFRATACETCRVLLDRLHKCNERLNKPSSLMWSLVGTKKTDDLVAVLRDVESLQMECAAVIAEVERHKADHHTRPN
jgi:hypothetical protein